MNFIQAVIEISKRKDLELCGSKGELRGEHNICVYFKKPGPEFIGSLNWPYLKEDGSIIPASVDFTVEIVLQEGLTKKEFDKRFKFSPFKLNKISYRGFKKI